MNKGIKKGEKKNDARAANLHLVQLWKDVITRPKWLTYQYN